MDNETYNCLVLGLSIILLVLFLPYSEDDND